jgi:predicted MFS family arabinose efflux permease
VGKKDLMNAIALNSSTFNAARIIGPAVGGVLIGSLGVAACFLLNGLSYIAVIAALLLINVPARPKHGLSGPFLQNALEGFHYARRQPVIRVTLVLIAVSTIFGAPYYVMLPVFAKDVLHVGADGYGFMMAAGGIGALTAALGLASLGNFPRKGALVLGGVVAFALAIEAFCWSHSFRFTVLCLVFAGSAMTLYGSTCNTLLQTTVPDYLRGRIMALFSLAFIGMAPLGSFQAGVMAEYFGVQIAVGLGAAVMGVSGLLILLTMPQMRKA